MQKCVGARDWELRAAGAMRFPCDPCDALARHLLISNDLLEFDGVLMASANPSVSRCSFLSKADKMAADSSPNEGSQETRTAVTGLSGAKKLPSQLLKERAVVLACPFRVGGPLAVEGFADFV